MDLFGYPTPGVDDNRMNSHYQELLKHNSQDTGGDGEDVKDIPHNAPPSGQKPTGPMKGDLMGWTKMLEAMEADVCVVDNYNGFISSEILQGTNATITDVVEVLNTNLEVTNGILNELEVLNKKLVRMNKRLALEV